VASMARLGGNVTGFSNNPGLIAPLRRKVPGRDPSRRWPIDGDRRAARSFCASARSKRCMIFDITCSCIPRQCDLRGPIGCQQPVLLNSSTDLA
jgi:hypothetical protein